MPIQQSSIHISLGDNIITAVGSPPGQALRSTITKYTTHLSSYPPTHYISGLNICNCYDIKTNNQTDIYMCACVCVCVCVCRAVDMHFSILQKITFQQKCHTPTSPESFNISWLCTKWHSSSLRPRKFIVLYNI